MGLEPTTCELSVQRADPLRRDGTIQQSDSVDNGLAYWKNLTAS